METKNLCSVCHSETHGTTYEMETGNHVCGDCLQTGYIVYLQQKRSEEWWALSLFRTKDEAEAAGKDVMNFPFVKGYTIEEAVYGQKSRQNSSQNSNLQPISANELRKMIETGNPSFQIIDLRTDKELEKGSIPGAVHITIKELPHKMATLSKDKEYIVVCSHGFRARYVCEFLVDNGYQARILTSGMMGWNGLGFVVSVMDTLVSVIKTFKKVK
ncbi:rhodanese-like domain-containing protein [Dendrosporobacter sp. 1207_IL3150]|uniref:rhodanese-like domain-containing protein n=1 Tax=Dendrosporobacter sp. 1207_IL3150 TaxID=3084054 RepID=UPI002FD912FF